jgi:biopolymer transport protein ExbB/TolQ
MRFPLGGGIFSEKDFAICRWCVDNCGGGQKLGVRYLVLKRFLTTKCRIFMSGLPLTLIAAATGQVEILYVLHQARPEAIVIIVLLFFSSIAVWYMMITKIIQMRRARKLNALFGQEFSAQKAVLEMYDRKLEVEGCPLYAVYLAGCSHLDQRLRGPAGERTKQRISLKNMEHIKRAIENMVAQESLKLESGLILLAIAVSGAPFMGLLGTVWGVMSTFAGIAQSPTGASLGVMAPGVSAALVTTVAGLLVAIPSMFGYNWLVHNLRVFTVELDNFAQELVSKMETEFLEEQ